MPNLLQPVVYIFLIECVTDYVMYQWSIISSCVFQACSVTAFPLVFQLLEKGTKLVLEQTVTTLASVADTAEEKFIQYYDR